MYDIISHSRQLDESRCRARRAAGRLSERYNVPFDSTAPETYRRAETPDGFPGTYRQNMLIGDARPDDAFNEPDSRGLRSRQIKPLTPIRRQSSFSISLEIASGFVTEPNRVITSPCLSTRNFVKFHLMPSVPSTPGASSVR